MRAIFRGEEPQLPRISGQNKSCSGPFSSSRRAFLPCSARIWPRNADLARANCAHACAAPDVFLTGHLTADCFRTAPLTCLRMAVGRNRPANELMST